MTAAVVVDLGLLFGHTAQMFAVVILALSDKNTAATRFFIILAASILFIHTTYSVIKFRSTALENAFLLRNGTDLFIHLSKISMKTFIIHTIINFVDILTVNAVNDAL
jgi:hypothetical protein